MGNAARSVACDKLVSNCFLRPLHLLELAKLFLLNLSFAPVALQGKLDCLLRPSALRKVFRLTQVKRFACFQGFACFILSFVFPCFAIALVIAFLYYLCAA